MPEETGRIGAILLEKLPDRQAAESIRMRIDWKYALHLPLEYEGFNFSVLSEFRDRLIAGKQKGEYLRNWWSKSERWV